MGLFDLLKKRKKEAEEPKLSKEDLKWNMMWDLWVNGNIESPYTELMEYLNGVNNGGHNCHLDNINGNSDLKTYIDVLTQILPQPLKDNLLLAYNTYIKNPDDLSDEDVDILDKCDDVYYKNEELINNIVDTVVNSDIVSSLIIN